MDNEQENDRIRKRDLRRAVEAEQRKQLKVLDRMNNPMYDEDFFACYSPRVEEVDAPKPVGEPAVEGHPIPVEKNTF